jgi:hypothetical protein
MTSYIMRDVFQTRVRFMETSLANVFIEMFSNLVVYLFINCHRKIEGHQQRDT